GVQVSEETIEVSIAIEQTETYEEMPIIYEDLEDGQEIEFISPSQPLMSMTIVGNDEDVSELTKEDFQISIDIEGLGEGEHRVPVSIDGPDNVKTSVEYEEVAIRIINNP